MISLNFSEFLRFQDTGEPGANPISDIGLKRTVSPFEFTLASSNTHLISDLKFPNQFRLRSVQSRSNFLFVLSIHLGRSHLHSSVKSVVVQGKRSYKTSKYFMVLQRVKYFRILVFKVRLNLLRTAAFTSSFSLV